MALIPLFLLAGAGIVGVALYFGLTSDIDKPERDVSDHEPEYEPPAPPPSQFTPDTPAGPEAVSKMPDKTGWKGVDKLLPQLKAASQSSGIPLGLLVGWVGYESAGVIKSAPDPLKGQPDSERGYFQLTPDESKSIGLTDHARLSTDPVYSINAGLALIGKYMGTAASFGVAKKGTAYFWLLVKLCHTMGSGATKKIVAAALGAGQAGSWTALQKYALANDAALFALVKHRPSKWFPKISSVVYKRGLPFGFGTEVETVLGGEVFSDIVDYLDVINPPR